MRFEFFISGRYLRTRQKHAFISFITLLSIAGVAVGVMALIVVIAVMAGFESDLKSRILGIESHAVITREKGAFSDYRRVLQLVSADADVVAATPFISSQVMLRSSTGLTGASLRGIAPETAGSVVSHFSGMRLNEKLLGQTAADFGSEVPGIILGRELARAIGVRAGDMIFVISPRGMLSPMGHLPSMKRFQVTDVFETGMYEYDGTIAYIGLAAAQKMLRMGDTVSGIEMRVRDLYQAKNVADRIVSQLDGSYTSRDWMAMNESLFSALKLEKVVMFIILALIVLVAAFNIASSLIMMVMKKKRDIGVLKAMGATRSGIRSVFVLQGMAVGAIGTVLGVSLGIILCSLLRHYRFIELPGDVYYITTLPVLLETMDILRIAIAAIVICFLATLYPANQAAKVDPVEAIRYG